MSARRKSLDVLKLHERALQDAAKIGELEHRVRTLVSLGQESMDDRVRLAQAIRRIDGHIQKLVDANVPFTGTQWDVLRDIRQECVTACAGRNVK